MNSASQDLSPTVGVKPKIYAFSNVVGGGDGVAYAMAEDGTVLGSHYCSHEGYVPHDLGVNEGSRPDRHEHYAAHYPDGYEMEFVRASDVATHAGLTLAFERNQAAAKAAEEASAPDAASPAHASAPQDDH